MAEIIIAMQSRDSTWEGVVMDWLIDQAYRVMGFVIEGVGDLFEKVDDLVRPEPDIKELERNGDSRKLIAALRHRHWWVRRDAFEALGRLRCSDSIEPMLRSLDDSELSHSRFERLRTLAGVAEQDPRALIDLLRSILQRARNSSDLCAPLDDILQLLVEMNTGAASEVLLHTLDHANADFRSAAVSAMSRVRDPSAVDSLVALLRIEKEDIRYAAIMALAGIHDAKAVKALVLAMGSSTEAVQWEIVKALGVKGVGDPRMVDPLLTLLLNNTRLDSDRGYLLIPYKPFLGRYAGLIERIFLSCDVAESDKAAKELRKIRTPVADNLLHIVARRPDVRNRVIKSVSILATSSEWVTLDFGPQRSKCRQELKRRGDPPYDEVNYSELNQPSSGSEDARLRWGRGFKR